MPEDAERKGLGTPATRAGILEKLVSTGFLERKNHQFGGCDAGEFGNRSHVLFQRRC